MPLLLVDLKPTWNMKQISSRSSFILLYYYFYYSSFIQSTLWSTQVWREHVSSGLNALINLTPTCEEKIRRIVKVWYNTIDRWGSIEDMFAAHIPTVSMVEQINSKISAFCIVSGLLFSDEVKNVMYCVNLDNLLSSKTSRLAKKRNLVCLLEEEAAWELLLKSHPLLQILVSGGL